MKISLIDYTGRGSGDPLYAARLLAYTKATRLTQGEAGYAAFAIMPEEDLNKELEYISKTIRSSWEMVDFTFQIEGVTRAFTHQFVRTRTASYAQQTQRAVNMSDFSVRVPYSISNDTTGESLKLWNSAMSAIRQAYKGLIDSGIPAQDARGLLPTNVLTSIIAKMNLRTLADLLAKRKNARAQDEYEEVVIEMEKRVLEVMPWGKSFLSPERTRTPELDAVMKRLVGAGSPVDKPEINAALKQIDALKGVWG